MTTPPVTEQTVPMIGPDGSAAFIPQSQAQAATDAGAIPSLVLRAPDGSRHAVPIKNVAGALQAGGMTEGQYQQSQAPPSPDALPVGAGASFLANSPIGMVKSAYSALTQPAQNANESLVTQGTAGPEHNALVHGLGQLGLGAYRTLVAPSVAANHAANDSIKAGHPLEALSEGFEGIPLVGGVVTAGKNAIQQYANGDKAGALGTVTGTLATGGLGAYLGGKLSGGNGGVSPLSSADNTALAVTKAVNPPLAAYNSLSTAVKAQLGNVMEYAKRNGLSISNARELSAVAKGAADETQAHYSDNMLAPYKGTLVPVDQGPLAGQASLGDVDQRINNINQDLRSGYRKPTDGQVNSALSGDDIREMNAEHAHLTDILHRSLGDLNGVDPQDIANTRIQAGQLRTIASEAQGGANAVTRGAGIQDIGAGSSLPQTVSPTHTLIHTILDKIPGFDPESIQGKKLRAALSASDIQPTQLTDVYPGNKAPMYQAPEVTAAYQQAAQRAALADYQTNIAGPELTRNANADTRNVRLAPAKALKAAVDLNNNVSPLARFIKAPNLNP